MSENKECLFYIDHNPPECSGTWGGAIYKGACKINSTSCNDTDKCFIKLLYQQVEQKEQECEVLKEKVKKYGEINEQETKDYAELKAENDELKKIINEAKNSKLDLQSFLVGEAIQEEYEQQLDQLKAENKHLSEKEEEAKHYLEEAEKFKNCLTEIKEIAENGKRFAERYMITGEQKANVLTYANAILQKISEVENANI